MSKMSAMQLPIFIILKKKKFKNEVSTLTIVFLWYLEGFHFYLQISKSTLKNEKLLHAGWWKVSDLLSWLVNFAGEE